MNRYIPECERNTLSIMIEIWQRSFIDALFIGAAEIDLSRDISIGKTEIKHLNIRRTQVVGKITATCEK